MARSSNQARRSDLFQESDAFIRSRAWIEMQVEEAREKVDAFLADRDRRLQEYEGLIEKTSEDFVRLIENNNSFDTDAAIDMFYKQEQDFVADRQTLSRQVDAALRKTADTLPEAITLHNYIRSELAQRFNRCARINRDARWRIMAARAEHTPSAGAGPVYGHGEPVE